MNDTQKNMIRHIFQHVITTQHDNVHEFLMGLFRAMYGDDGAFDAYEAWQQLEGWICSHGLEEVPPTTRPGEFHRKPILNCTAAHLVDPYSVYGDLLAAGDYRVRLATGSATYDHAKAARGGRVCLSRDGEKGLRYLAGHEKVLLVPAGSGLW